MYSSWGAAVAHLQHTWVADQQVNPSILYLRLFPMQYNLIEQNLDLKYRYFTFNFSALMSKISFEHSFID